MKDPAATDDTSIFVAGDAVELFNAQGLKVVGVIRRGGRLYVPNPTRARIVAGPRPTSAWTEVYDVQLSEGPHAGRIVAACPAALRPAGPAAPARRRFGFRAPLGR
jgi:hypothetical protein